MAGTQELESLLIKILGDATGLQNAMKQAEGTVASAAKNITATLDTMGRGMQTVGKKMSQFVTAPIVAGLSASVYAFAGFDDAMAKSTAIMGDVSAEMRAKMEEVAITLSNEGVNSAEDLAKSYFYLASAGMTAEESIGALPIVNSFATAGAFDLATATDLLTDAQSALGMNVGTTAERMEKMVLVSDTLVGANVLANASVEQFSQALTHKAAAALKTYGKSIQEGVAVLTVMADQGTKGAEAGIQLDRLTRLMTGASIANKDFHESVGFSVFDKQTGEMRPYHDIIRNITDITKNMTKENKAATLTQMGFDARIQGVLLPLLGNADAIERNEAVLRGMAGYTKEVAEKNLQSFSAQIKILWNQITNVSIAIGKKLAPILAKLADGVKKLIEWWNGMGDALQWVVIGVGLLLAAAGPLVFAFGSLLLLTSSLIKSYTFMAALEGGLSIKMIATTVATIARTAAQWLLNAAMAAMPFAVFGLAVAGLITMHKWIYDNIGGMKKLNAEKERSAMLDGKLAELRKQEQEKTMKLIDESTGLEKAQKLKDEIQKVKNSIADQQVNIERQQAEADKLGADKEFGMKAQYAIPVYGVPLALYDFFADKEIIQEQLDKVKSIKNKQIAEIEHMKDLQNKLKETEQKIKDAGGGGGEKVSIIQKEREALDELNKSLKVQRDTYGMTASEIEIYKARLTDASETELHALVTTQLQNDAIEEEIKVLKEEEEAMEKRKNYFKDTTKQMDDQIATLNMTTSELAAYAAEQEGLNDIEVAIIKVKAEKLKAMREEKKMMEEGKQLTKALRKPEEQLADGQKKLKEMLELGAISVETYGRAMEKLEKDMQVKVSFSVSGIDAVSAGSLEAMARVEEFRALASDPNKVDFRKEGQAIVDAPNKQAEWEAEAAMWEEEQRRQNTVEWKQKNTPTAPVDTTQAGLEFAKGLTYNDLPGSMDNYTGGGLTTIGEEVAIANETRDSNEIIAENTGKMVDAFGNISQAGFK